MSDTSNKRDDIPPRSDVIAKLLILETWSQAGIPWSQDASGAFERDSKGEKVLDYFPTRSIHFSAWDGTQNCAAAHLLYPELGRLKQTRRRTLPDSHPDLQSRLVDVLEALRVKSKTQLESANKTSRIDELEKKAEFWQSLARKQEGEIIALRERMFKTERALRMAQATIKNNLAESNRVVASDAAKIASLTEMLSKISPIR